MTVLRMWTALGLVLGQGVSQPPAEWTTPAVCSYLRPTPNLRARVLLSPKEKRVHIGWHSAPGAFSPTSDGASQDVTVGYWPTAAEVVAPDTLLVAGVDPGSGNTVVEVWKFRPPLVRQEPPASPESGRVALDALRPPTITKIRDAPGDTIEMILRNRGDPARAFLLLGQSNELHEIDWTATDPSPRSVLSPTTEPSLAQEYDTCFTGDHSSQGYVYVLSDEESFGRVRPLVLIDDDRDGNIDLHLAMTRAEYDARDLSDADRYLDLFGN